MSFGHDRGERLVLFHRIGDHKLERLIARLGAVRRPSRDLKTVAGLDHAVGLPFDGELRAALGGFDAGMGVVWHGRTIARIVTGLPSGMSVLDRWSA